MRKTSGCNLVRWLVMREVEILPPCEEAGRTPHPPLELLLLQVCTEIRSRGSLRQMTTEGRSTKQLSNSLQKSRVHQSQGKVHVDHELDLFSMKAILGTTGKTWVGSKDSGVWMGHSQSPEADSHVSVTQENVLVCRECTLKSWFDGPSPWFWGRKKVFCSVIAAFL